MKHSLRLIVPRLDFIQSRDFLFRIQSNQTSLTLLSLFGPQFELGYAARCVMLVFSVAFLRIKGLALTVAAGNNCDQSEILVA